MEVVVRDTIVQGFAPQIASLDRFFHDPSVAKAEGIRAVQILRGRNPAKTILLLSHVLRKGNRIPRLAFILLRRKVLETDWAVAAR